MESCQGASNTPRTPGEAADTAQLTRSTSMLTHFRHRAGAPAKLKLMDEDAFIFCPKPSTFTPLYEPSDSASYTARFGSVSPNPSAELQTSSLHPPVFFTPAPNLRNPRHETRCFVVVLALCVCGVRCGCVAEFNGRDSTERVRAVRCLQSTSRVRTRSSTRCLRPTQICVVPQVNAGSFELYVGGGAINLGFARILHKVGHPVDDYEFMHK